MRFFRDEITPAEEKGEVLGFVKRKRLEDSPSLQDVHVAEAEGISS